MWRCTVTALLLLVSLGNYAAGASPAAGTPDKDVNAANAGFSAEEAGARLEQVVVTAQRRTEKLQDVPISAQVISAQRLVEQNQNSLEDLTQTVPAVHVSTGDQSNDMFIRGIGSGGNPSFDQSVATFVDDIYHGRSRVSGATFLDLERIEVLKGPQSTFFGNNAIAGALNVVTKKPGKDFDASGRLLYGRFGQYAAEGAVGGPITDVFGARVAFTRNGTSEGWIDNVNLGQHVPRVNNLAGRVTLSLSPSEELDATLKVEGGRHRTAGSWFDAILQRTDCPRPAPFANGFAEFGSCAVALTLGVPIGIRDKTSGLPGQGNSLSTFESVLSLNYNKWGHTFSVVSGFYNYHFNSNKDAGLLPVEAIGTVQFPEKYHQFSQEIRIASPTGQPLEYLAGAYFQTDDLTSNAELNAPLLDPIVNGLPPFAPLRPYLPIAQSLFFRQQERVYSIFGSVGWNMTDRLKLTGGLRGSRVKKDFNGVVHYGTGTQLYGGFVQMPAPLEPLAGIFFGAPGTKNLNRTDNAWMPSADLQYQVAREVMVYFSFRRGFKAGGFNGQQFGNIPNVAFGPEHVSAYELGLKSNWLDDTVLLNLDVFRGNYKGLQVNAGIFDPLTNTTTAEVANAATSVSQGVEFETQWAPAKAFRLGANITYLDAHYGSYPNASAANLQTYCSRLSQAAYSATAQCAVFPFPVPQFQDLSGKPTDYAPKWSGSVTLSYNVLNLGDYRVTTELNPYWTTGYFTSGATDDPYQYVGPSVRLDARLTFERRDGRWGLDVVGKNLADRNIVTSIPTLGETIREQPRSVAVQFRGRW
jgi:outer membrane receptor protein involved in Fe transport